MHPLAQGRAEAFERMDGSAQPSMRMHAGGGLGQVGPSFLITPIFHVFFRFFPVFPWTFGRVSWIHGVQTLKMGERWGNMGKQWVKNGIAGLQKTALMHASAHLCQVDRESIDDERAPAVLEACARRSSRSLRIPVRVTEVVPFKISMRVRSESQKPVRAKRVEVRGEGQ